MLKCDGSVTFIVRMQCSYIVLHDGIDRRIYVKLSALHCFDSSSVSWYCLESK